MTFETTPKSTEPTKTALELASDEGKIWFIKEAIPESVHV